MLGCGWLPEANQAATLIRKMVELPSKRKRCIEMLVVVSSCFFDAASKVTITVN
jgi:hypothetical protein